MYIIALIAVNTKFISAQCRVVVDFFNLLHDPPAYLHGVCFTFLIHVNAIGLISVIPEKAVVHIWFVFYFCDILEGHIFVYRYIFYFVKGMK